MIALALSIIAAGVLQQTWDSAGLMTPGISRGLAAHRAAQIRDVRYSLTLDLTRLDTARGSVRVSFQLRAPGEVVLDFRGPALSTVAVNGTTVSSPDWNGAHLRIPT